MILEAPGTGTPARAIPPLMIDRVVAANDEGIDAIISATRINFDMQENPFLTAYHEQQERLLGEERSCCCRYAFFGVADVLHHTKAPMRAPLPSTDVNDSSIESLSACLYNIITFTP